MYKVVELIEDTTFYKKGERAYLINDTDQENSKKCEVRFINEHYIGNDVDVLPKSLFKEVRSTEVKQNTHIVIKKEDLKYISAEEMHVLMCLLNKISNGRVQDNKSPKNKYYIVNQDEPYAEKILNIILSEESDNSKIQ